MKLIVIEGLDGSGRRDALENFASGRGLAATYVKLGGSPKIDGEAPEGLTISRLAQKGDPVALKAFEMEGRYLGQVIAMCCSVLDPEKVILGGGVRLFPPEGPALPLRLTRHTVCNGVVELVYVRRDAPPPV